MDEKTRQALRDIVGSDNFTEKTIDLVSYSYDASLYDHRPDAAIWASSTEEISRILALANEKRIPVTARGAGTGLSGLAVAAKGGIVLDVSRMNRILQLNMPDRLVVVQPGVVYADLQAVLLPYGFFFPPDPASGVVCTLGGNVATNAGGLRGAKYGTTRDYVLGLEVVLADGDVMRAGSRTMKTSSGYDLCRLFVGSEGTFGVITEITLKVRPRPAKTATALATFQSTEDAGETVTKVMQSDVTPSVLELLDKTVIGLLRTYANIDLPEVEAILLVETDGMMESDVEHQLDKVTAMFRECHALEVETAANPTEAERLWKARKAIGGMIGVLPFDCLPEDVTVPMSQIAVFLKRSQELARKHGLGLFNFGHVGDGNFHTNILYDHTKLDHMVRLERLLYEIHKLACDLGGTLSGEHGIGMTKAPYMPLEHDPAALKVMRLLKRSLDPNNILNPGKMFLDARPCSTPQPTIGTPRGLLNTDPRPLVEV